MRDAHAHLFDTALQFQTRNSVSVKEVLRVKQSGESKFVLETSGSRKNGTVFIVVSHRHHLMEALES